MPRDLSGHRGFFIHHFLSYPTFPLLGQPLRLARCVTGLLSGIRLTRGEIGALIRAHDGVLGIRDAPFEFPNALADRRPYLWQTLGAEEEENDEQDEQDLPHPEITHRDPLEKRPGDQIRHEDTHQAQK
jgi:hypothetical protein